ncbi:hypothetical protein [Schinkia azotoformans]|uniref:hypothetical protein n=1 Tax=Schinkia azotoformans TaxID=1454 RepID=UPI002DBD45CA|nr:hypothetical protein [Schinkia azotoformans]MEC1768297.1 hypothetical protein [Schinkia azotoformans]
MTQIVFSQTETFISALEEWNEKTTNTGIQDYETLLFILINKLGQKGLESPTVEVLRERLNYLVEVQKIDEDLLITGLVKFVSETLEKNIKSHGSNILFHEEIVNSGEFIEKSIEILERLKSKSYFPKAEIELEVWEKIVSEKMSKSNRNIWENERMKELSSQMNKVMNSISNDVWDLFKDVPIGKLKKYVNYEELAGMSLEEAKEIRKNIQI